MKKRPVPHDDFFDGFFQWLGSDKGETSMEAMEAVAAALQGADLDIKERRIIWPDGKRLTIYESAEKIQKQTGGRCQESCRLNRFHAACLTEPMMSEAILSGLRKTTEIGSQFLTFPVHRFGWRLRAAS